MNKFKECRLQAGLSQKFVAKTLKVASPSVSNWESGKTMPTPENLAALASLYGVSVDYLLGRDEPSTPAEDVPFNPRTDYAKTHGPETQEIINMILDKLESLPEGKREAFLETVEIVAKGLSEGK